MVRSQQEVEKALYLLVIPAVDSLCWVRSPFPSPIRNERIRLANELPIY